MSLMLDLPPETQRVLEEKVKQHGLTLVDYLNEPVRWGAGKL